MICLQMLCPGAVPVTPLTYILVVVTPEFIGTTIKLWEIGVAGTALA